MSFAPEGGKQEVTVSNVCRSFPTLASFYSGDNEQSGLLPQIPFHYLAIRDFPWRNLISKIKSILESRNVTMTNLERQIGYAMRQVKKHVFVFEHSPISDFWV